MTQLLFSIAILNATLFFALSMIHVYWLVGGTWGINGVIPVQRNGQNPFAPSPLATFVVALGLFSFCLSVLIYVDVISLALPFWLKKTIMGLIAAIFLLRAIGDYQYFGLFKKITETRFANNDRRYFTPLCLFIFASLTVVTLLY